MANIEECLSTHTENVDKPAGRSVRANRGQGGHAYQLANALIPKHQKDRVHKKNQEIPENVPENPMAPPAVRPAMNKVITIFYSS